MMTEENEKRKETANSGQMQRRVSAPVNAGLSAAQLRWWKKDKLGWPIETVNGRPISNITRMMCQNIRKITG
jgi:hypothetical protein